MGFNNDRRGFGCASSAKTYTVEDYPLTLPDIKKLKTLSILGNSSQDGTPSPDNPVDVVGTGERTGNLFDISSLSGSNIEVKGTDIYLSGYDCSTNTSPEKFMEMTGTQQNDMITVFLKTDVIHGFSNSALGRIGFVRKKDSNVVYLNYNKQTSVFTIPSDFSSENYGNMILYGAQLADETGQRIAVVSEPAVYKGSYTADTLPPYESYGYKVAVTASGRNLFDYKNILDTNGTVKLIEFEGRQCISWISNQQALNQRFLQGKFKENTAYTFSINRKSVPSGGGFAIDYTDGTKTVINDTDNWTNSIVISDKNKTVSHIRGIYSSRQTEYFDINNTQIIEGAYTADTLPPYEPYKSPQSFNVYTPEVLHGVGSAHDAVVLDFDKRKAELVKYAGYFDLNNINAIAISGSMDGVLYRHYFRPDLLMKSGTGLVGFCNVLPEPPLWTGNNIENVHFGQGNQAIYFMTTNQYDNKDDLIAYLSNKGQSTPYVIYPLATPTTTDITALQDWEALPQLKGTWVLTATGGTEPTLKATYTSNTDPYTDYSDIVSVLPVYPDLDIDTDDPISEWENTEETEDQKQTTV